MGNGTETFESILELVRWGGVATSVLIVIGVWIALGITHRFVTGISDRFPARRLLINKIETFFQFFVYVATGTVALLLSLKVDKTVLTVIGGTIAVSVGFALKDLVASFVAGIVIMIDQPFQVGDRVSFGGQYGDITAIGLRSVRMQTLDDNTVTIPNNRLMTEVASCGNYGKLDMMVVVDVYVGAHQNITEARKILREAALTSQYIFLAKPVEVIAKQVIQESYVAVLLSLRAYVSDTTHEKAFETDVSLRTMATLRERGFAPPTILHKHFE